MSTEEVLKLILSGMGVLGLYILSDLTRSVRCATKEISELNVKIGMIIQKGESHEKEILLIKSVQDNIRERLHALGNIVNGLQIRQGD